LLERLPNPSGMWHSHRVAPCRWWETNSGPVSWEKWCCNYPISPLWVWVS